MSKEWILPGIVLVLAGALLIFLIVKNRQDQNKFERHMNRNYRKSKDEEGENDVTDTKT